MAKNRSGQELAVFEAATRAVELAAEALQRSDSTEAARALELANSLRIYYEQRFQDNAKLYDERNQSLHQRLQRQDDEADRRYDDVRKLIEGLVVDKATVGTVTELERQVAELREGKASADVLSSYRRWQLGLVIGVIFSFLGLALTLALAVYNYTHGAAP